MTRYSFITLGDIYHDVILRLGNHRNAENISQDLVVMYINRAIREVMSITMPFYEWGYKSSMYVSNKTILPTTYLDYIRVLCSASGAPPYNEARYIDPKEWFTITNWQRAQAWNQGSFIRPVFTIYGLDVDNLDADTRLAIYLYPNTDNISISGPPPGYRYPNQNMEGILEYYRAPDYISDMDEIIQIPYATEDLLINYSLSRVYAKLTDPEKMQEVMLEITKWKASIQKLYQEKREKEKRNLESFVEIEPPLAPAPPEEGELPKQLYTPSDVGNEQD